MATGTVHVWSQGRGSGWIRPDGGGDRVYVHKSGLTSVGEGLATGQRVEYQIGQRPKGSAAINVRPATGAAAEPFVRQPAEVVAVPAKAAPAAKGAPADEPAAEDKA